MGHWGALKGADLGPLREIELNGSQTLQAARCYTLRGNGLWSPIIISWHLSYGDFSVLLGGTVMLMASNRQTLASCSNVARKLPVTWPE